ncbi:conjugal transfer protein TrbL [Aeromicrobium flavum]|uniref:conjugal transfer protein TrbL n=1 Tax=Aeromicrobium flavum TaxID=416568 RepID=UPI0031D14915
MPVISAVCDQAGDAAGTLVTAPFDWLAESMANAAGWMFEAVWQVFDSTTMVDVTSGQFTKVYSILFGVAVFVMLGFFMLQVIGGMIRREPAALSRAVFGLAKSVLGSFVALALIGTALEVTDRLCVGIVHATGTTMGQMGDRVSMLAKGIGALQIAAPGASAVITILVAGLALGAAVIVWVSLLIRKALLLIAIVFAPIALAGASWDHTRGWVGRWATFVIALILSKVVLVVFFLLATAQVSAPIDADLKSVSEPISGVVLMLMAGFAPYLTYKAVSFIGFDMHHAMSAEQEAKSALNRPVPIPLGRGSGKSPQAVLAGPTSSGSPGGGPVPPSAKPAGANGSAVGGASKASGAVGAAGGPAVAGLVVKEAATSGPKVGKAVAGAAEGQSSAAEPRPAPAGPPRPADPLIAGSGS